MTDIEKRVADALSVSEEMQAMPIDVLVTRANQAILEKQWVMASALFAQVAAKAAMIGSFAMKKEIERLKGELNAP